METNQSIPTQEAIKAAQMVSRYLYWMANQVNKERIHEIYPGIMGDHLWSKLVSQRNRVTDTLAADVMFWFELDNTNRYKLMQYIISSGYKSK